MCDCDLDRFLPYRMGVPNGDGRRDFARRCGAGINISIAERRSAAFCGRSGPVSTRDIIQRVDLGKRRVGRAAARRKTAGFVPNTPDPQDGRDVVFSVTPSGEGTVDAQKTQFVQDTLLGRVNLREAVWCAEVWDRAGPGL